MIRTFLNSFKVSFAENANIFIFFLRRLPILGKRIPERLYKENEAKLVIGVIREVLGIIFGFLAKSLYLGLLIILPAYFIAHKTLIYILPVFLQILFFMSFVLGPLMKSVVFGRANKSAFNMIVLMRDDAREYYLSQIIFLNLKDFLCFILPTIIIGLIIGFSPLYALALGMELIAMRLVAERLLLLLHDRTGKVLTKQVFSITVILITGLVCAYALPILGYTINFRYILFNVFGIIAFLGIGIAAAISLWNYKRFTATAKALLSKEHIFNGEVLRADLTFAGVKLDERRSNKQELDKRIFADKHGYDYLNALFFRRHRRLMVHAIRTKVLIIGLALLGVAFWLKFGSGAKISLAAFILARTPAFVFVMYFLSAGESMCKAMFYNCDVSLLRYSFYREGKVILSNFTLRLKQTVLLNTIPALALCLALAGLIWANGQTSVLIGMVPVFLSIVFLACFFSIHHLVLYYTIQPYTAELTIQSPLFKVINIVVYMASYECLQIKTTSYYFSFGILAVTIVYMVASLILTYKVAPRTFRLR